MARRFSDIKRAKRLETALAGYMTYLQKPASTTLPTYKARPKQQSLILSPFGIELEGETKAVVYAGEASVTNLLPIVSQVADVAENPGTGDLAELTGFRPARVINFASATKTVTTGDSKFTGLPYRKYAGDRFALPFGRKTSTDVEIDISKAIKARLRGRPNLEVNRVSFTPERQAQR